ncbi:MAG: hypothetical protein NTW69_20185 [Chloroflexi bacterium]|nr:hypothetical protein [Chloroflexota bacterium]
MKRLSYHIIRALILTSSMPGERGHADQFVSLLDFDLSISSPLLSGDSNQNKESSLTPRICFDGTSWKSEPELQKNKYDSLTYRIPRYTLPKIQLIFKSTPS